MEIKGKLTEVLPLRNGTSNSGKDWSELTFILETEGQYPKKVAIVAKKQDLITAVQKLKVGEMVTASVNIESREYQGKWFTQVNLWRVEL